MAFNVSSERQRQSGVDKIAQVSKWQKVLSKLDVCCIIKLSIIIYA